MSMKKLNPWKIGTEKIQALLWKSFQLQCTNAASENKVARKQAKALGKTQTKRHISGR